MKTIIEFRKILSKKKKEIEQLDFKKDNCHEKLLFLQGEYSALCWVIQDEPEFYKRKSFGKKRHLVYQRDNYKCRECGATKEETTLEIDHIIPWAKGGKTELDNLQTLCRNCNHSKHTRTWVGGQ